MSSASYRWKILGVLILAVVVVSGISSYFFLKEQELREQERLELSDSDGDRLLDRYNLTLMPQDIKAKGLVDRGIIYRRNSNGTLTFYGELSLGTDPSTPNPNVAYALEHGLSPDLAVKLKPLDADGKMDSTEQTFDDYLLNTNLGRLLPKDIELIGTHAIDQCLKDGRISDEEVTALSFLQQYSGQTQLRYSAFNGDVVRYFAFLPSLKKEDADYAVNHMLRMKDLTFTSLDAQFLLDPKKYAADVIQADWGELAKTRPDVAAELRKLPDLNLKTVGIKEAEANEDVVYSILLSKNPSVVANNLKAMLAEGIPDKRKVDTPLQALLWHYNYVDNDCDRSNPLEDRGFDVVRFVQYAWITSPISNNYQSEMWNSYDVARDRVNSPGLVNLFINDYLTYDMSRIHVHPQGPHLTYALRRGVCRHAAYIGTDFLTYNGYDAKDVTILSAPGKGHSVTAVKLDSKIQIVVDFTGRPRQIEGPFETYTDVEQFIARRNGYVSIFKVYVDNNYQIMERNNDLE